MSSYTPTELAHLRALSDALHCCWVHTPECDDPDNDANRPAWLTGDPEWDRSNFNITFNITNMPAGVRSWDEANQ